MLVSMHISTCAALLLLLSVLQFLNFQPNNELDYLIAGRGSEKASKLSKPDEQQKYPTLKVKDYEWLKQQLSEQAMPSQQIIIDESAIEVTVGNTEWITLWEKINRYII